MLDHLAGSGHVERALETDRRVVVSRLTAQGAQIEAKREAWKSRWDEALAGVAASELRPPPRCSSGSARCSRRLAQEPARGR